jgi:hypothetical protein
MEELYAGLQAELTAAVVPTGVVHGLGGVGKIELALEFAHRFASDYDIACGFLLSCRLRRSQRWLGWLAGWG